ncbi:MAG: hydrolase, partial [Microcoleaceae cyanobacterium]
MGQTQVIFLDAVGTLFGVKDSVGEVYRNLALQFNVDVPAERLNQAFFQSFSTAAPMAFPGAHPDQIPEQEFNWWHDVELKTFQTADVMDEFTDFSKFL